ncbi:group-specific protein [Legionella sp. WA2022007384]
MMNRAINKVGLFLGIFLSSMSFVVNAGKLLPPWYLLNNQLSATLNADPCVHVGNLAGDGLEMEIKVTVCNEDKARALASFINRVHEYGDKLAVTVKVYSDSIPVEANTPSTPDEAVELINIALKGNEYFVGAGLGTRQHDGTAYALFKPMVVQYYADDTSDWYLNKNEVAAKAFGAVFNIDPYIEGAIKMYASTEIIEEDKNK